MQLKQPQLELFATISSQLTQDTTQAAVCLFLASLLTSRHCICLEFK